jgi:hypothetical protein
VRPELRLTGMRRAIAILAGTLGLAACGSGGQPSAEPTRVTVSASTAGSATPLSPLPLTPISPAPSGQPRRSDCVASTEQATVRPNEEVGPVCLLVGAKLEVTAAPSPTQPWQLLVSSDAAVLRCTSTAGPNGTVSGSCQALKPGSVTVSTQTKSPTNGASDRWRLTVVVQ